MRVQTIVLPLIMLLLILHSQAGALQLQIENKNVSAGESITIDITVGDYNQEQIAAAAYLLIYYDIEYESLFISYISYCCLAYDLFFIS